MRSLLVILWAVPIVFSGCSKEPTKTEDNAFQQEHIPWPSLADSPWPMFLHDAQHTGRSPYRGPQEGKVEWMFETGRSVYSSPAIGPDHTIYFGSNDSSLYAVNPDGSLRWKFKTDVPIVQSHPLISSDETIYFASWGSSIGYYYALFQDGTLRWKTQATGGNAAVISKDGETIYMGTQPFSAQDTRTGDKKWELEISAITGAAMSPDGESIYIGDYDGHLYCIDTNGIIKWELDLGGTLTSPSVDNDGNIYANARYYCYSVTPDGQINWKFSLGNYHWASSPSIGLDGTIYVVGLSKLYALDNSGELIWEFDLQSVGGSPHEKFSDNTPISDSEGTVYIGTLTWRTLSDTINFIAINSDGTLKYAMSLKSPPRGGVPEEYLHPDIDSTPAISKDGKIYVGSDRPQGRHVYKIN